MYTKDKNTRITLRLNDEQFNFVKLNADTIGVSPSEFLRIVINSTMSQATYNAVMKGKVAGRENDEAHINDII